MHFGNVTILIDDLPVYRKTHVNGYMPLSKEEKSLKMLILHTAHKFFFNDFLRIKLLDYINGTDIATESDNFFNYRQNLNELDAETIDYFIGDYEKFVKLLHCDLPDDKLYEIYNNRISIIKS